MSENGRHQDAGQAAIRLEYYSWLATELKGVGEAGTTVQVPIVDGTTVRAVLERLAAENPRFEELVYDRGADRVKEYATLILNGRTIELAGGLDARLRPGDHLLLLPGFSGG
jgi:molybdopterin converting factor small subunit